MEAWTPEPAMGQSERPHDGDDTGSGERTPPRDGDDTGGGERTLPFPPSPSRGGLPAAGAAPLTPARPAARGRRLAGPAAPGDQAGYAPLRPEEADWRNLCPGRLRWDRLSRAGADWSV